MRYLTVDGMFSGTGVRNSFEGGYIEPDELGLSSNLSAKITQWLKGYEDAHYMQYKDKTQVAELDAEGIEICKMIKNELPDSKIEYYSSAETRKLDVGK
jgi:hypothetical protein